MDTDTLRFASAKKWAEFVFDRPLPAAGEEAWYWDLEIYGRSIDCRHSLLMAAETFENAAANLSCFSNAQIEQGLRYISSNACSDQLQGLSDDEIPEDERIRALRSFIPLFRDVVAVRFPTALRHLNESCEDFIGCSIYMWWDVLPICGKPESESGRRVDEVVYEVMERILDIPHDGVRESALHGLGEWSCHYEERTRATVLRFLDRTPNLRPELKAYAKRAAEGMIL